MIAKFILPWFGGTSVVWTTCLMFFQVLLVAGYAYAHVLNRYFKPRLQLIIHTFFLCTACLLLPIRPSDSWKPDGGGDPALQISLLLLATVGLPFFVLTTTSPLIQAWMAKSLPDKSPYRLYALSNVGSLLALLSYPFLIEPWLNLTLQSTCWSLAFVFFALLCFWSGWQFLKASQHADQTTEPVATLSTDEASNQSSSQSLLSGKKLIISLLLWTLLPAAASVTLVASTNLMTNEIAAVPFLWIVPLCLYLLTFIICFDHPRWYVRPLVWFLMVASVIFGCLLMNSGIQTGIAFQFLGYSAVVFFVAFACHGELARIKPEPGQLTLFFMMVGIGGALGGIFVAIIAPRIFNDLHEFFVGLWVAPCVLFLALIFQFSSLERQQKENESPKAKPTAAPFRRFVQIGNLALYTVLAAVTAAFVIGSYNYYESELDPDEMIFRERSPYGILIVNDYEEYQMRELINGRIEHGVQWKEDYWRTQPTSYYVRPEYYDDNLEYSEWYFKNGSGLGVACEYFRQRETGPQFELNIGVVGLGIGTVCAYAEQGDLVRFYEINPEVEPVAREYFTYIDDCRGEFEVVLGDARLQLEKELKEDDIKFDLLVIDAFSSDAVPTHLLTLECFETYRRRLKENGILAVHVSNRYLYLETIVENLSRELDYPATLIDVDDPSSTWVLLSDDPVFHEIQPVASAGLDFPESKTDIVWTDDFAPIFPIVYYEEGLGENFLWFFKDPEESDENDSVDNSESETDSIEQLIEELEQY